jgi:hypothetical protein
LCGLINITGLEFSGQGVGFVMVARNFCQRLLPGYKPGF